MKNKFFVDYKKIIATASSLVATVCICIAVFLNNNASPEIVASDPASLVEGSPVQTESTEVNLLDEAASESVSNASWINDERLIVLISQSVVAEPISYEYGYGNYTAISENNWEADISSGDSDNYANLPQEVTINYRTTETEEKVSSISENYNISNDGTYTYFTSPATIQWVCFAKDNTSANLIPEIHTARIINAATNSNVWTQPNVLVTNLNPDIFLEAVSWEVSEITIYEDTVSPLPTLTLYPENATITPQEMSYNAPQSFSVSLDTWTVSASEPGDYTMYILAEGIKAYLNVHVASTDIPVEDLYVSTPSISMKEGSVETIQTEIQPADATDTTLQWISSDSSIASVDDNGVVTANAPGHTVITIYTSNNDVYKTVDVEVTADYIPVTVLSVRYPSLVYTGSVTTPTVKYAPLDATNPQVTFTSSDTSIATVDAETGAVTALATGRVKISAVSADGIEASDSTIVVREAFEMIESISLSKYSVSMTEGETATISAIVNHPDGTYSSENVEWSTSDSSVATVINGEITAVSEGTTTITASYNQASASVTVKVKAPVSLDYVNITSQITSIEVGNTIELAATGSKEIVWASSDSNVVSISGNVATAHKTGSVIIKATSGTATASFTLKVTKKQVLPTSITISNSSINIGNEDVLYVNLNSVTNLSVSFVPSATTNRSVTWESSDSNIISVNNGVLTAHNPGTVTITATAVNGVSSSIVVESIINGTFAINNAPSEIKVGETYQLDYYEAYYGLINCVSNNPRVATITNNGLITANAPGTATIAVSYREQVITIEVTVVPVEEIIPDATSITFDVNDIALQPEQTATINAIVYPENCKQKELTWTSSDETVATVDSNGYVIAVNPGTAIITAVTENGVSQSVQVTVTKKVIEISSLYVGSAENVANVNSFAKININYYPANADTDFEITSTSSAATFSEDRMSVSSSRAAIITVKVKDKISGISAKTSIKFVTSTTLNAFEVPANIYLKVGDEYTITPSYKPAAANPTINYAASSNDYIKVDGNKVTAIAVGKSSIKVTTGKLTRWINVSVLPKDSYSVSELDILDDYYKLLVGQTENIRFETDCTSNNVGIVWSTSDSKIATVTSSGYITAKAAGTVTITATSSDNKISDSCVVYVSKDTNNYEEGTISMTAESSYVLQVGETLTLEDLGYSVSPANLADIVSIKSTNPRVVSYDNKSTFTAMSYGQSVLSFSLPVGNKYNIVVYVDKTPEQKEQDRKAFASEVVRLCNEERAAKGLAPLNEDISLDIIAQIRANECIENYSHTRPDGTKWSTVFANYANPHTMRGENLASSYSATPQQFVDMWMQSPGHAANILNSSYKYIGVGVVLSYDYVTDNVYASYVSQLFTN